MPAAGKLHCLVLNLPATSDGYALAIQSAFHGDTWVQRPLCSCILARSKGKPLTLPWRLSGLQLLMVATPEGQGSPTRTYTEAVVTQLCVRALSMRSAASCTPVHEVRTRHLPHPHTALVHLLQ